MFIGARCNVDLDFVQWAIVKIFSRGLIHVNDVVTAALCMD